MRPPSPLLCPESEKPSREGANGVAQLDYLTHLVTERPIAEIRESHVLELQRLAVAGIYPCAGEYRDGHVRVVIEGSKHELPPFHRVQQLVIDLVDHLNRTRDTEPATRRAAYALWRLNWIHPFRGGNGRTSRALCYLVLCMDMQMMLPGTPTVPSLIYERRREYVSALRAVDASVDDIEGSAPDLTAMEELVTDVVTRQLASAIDRLARRETPPS